jgi:2,5-diamino-6-(ribosylamino)-4(3H)-pyrimidinone 5'-phosphate reductase
MQRPMISTNLAISADGKISSVGKIPSGWTSREDHARLLTLRKDADALLVGHGTLRNDQMTMTVPGKNPQPLRCVVSRSGKISPDLPLFHKLGGPIHLLVTGDCGPSNLGPDVQIHRESLEDFLKTLARDYAVKRLHCEGGGELVRELAELDIIDEFHLTIAGHTIFGGVPAPTPTGSPTDFLKSSKHFEITYFDPNPELGECFLTYSRTR